MFKKQILIVALAMSVFLPSFLVHAESKKETVLKETYSQNRAVSYAGNSMSDAASISIGENYNGALTTTNSKDYYKFTIGSSGKVTLTASAGMEYIYYSIYDSDGVKLWEMERRWNTTTELISTEETIDLTKGTYYFIAEKRYGSTGTYSFQLNFLSANESFTETSSSNDNSMSSANVVSVNTYYQGQIAQNDVKDFYRFTWTSLSEVTLKTNAEIEYIAYYIFDSNGNELWSIERSWNTTTKLISMEETIDLTSGTYYFVVEKRYGSTGNYSFTLSTGSQNAGAGGSGSVSKVEVNQEWRNASYYTLFVGQNMTMNKSGLSGNIVWRSSKPNVASVDSNGVIRAKKPGTAVISASVGGKTFKSTIKVNSVLSISKKSIKVPRNGRVRTVTVTLRRRGYLTYHVKNSSRVSCYWGSWKGNKCKLRIYGRKRGKAVITITNSYNNEKKKITVRVR